MKKWYYIIFIIALYLLNDAFQQFVVVNGLIYGLIAGLVIAFLAKLIFSVVTKTVIFIAVLTALAAFLFSLGILELPAFLQDLLNLGQITSIFN